MKDILFISNSDDSVKLMQLLKSNTNSSRWAMSGGDEGEEKYPVIGLK